MDLRQFVYLDDLAVRSLLASEGIPVPEKIEEINENTNDVQGGGGIKGGVEVPLLGNINAGGDLSASKQSREMLQTQRRITNQYVFDILHNEAEDDIINVVSEGMPSEPGEIVKMNGVINTDVLFRILKMFSVFSDVIDTENKEQILRAEELLYQKGIGVTINSPDTQITTVSRLNPYNLWVDQERAFIGEKEYSVFGRVYDTFGDQEVWDYLDIVQIMDTVVSDNSMKELRNIAADFLSLLANASQSYDRPDFSDAEVDTFQQFSDLKQLVDTDQSQFQLDIDDREVAVEGPGVVVEPIAIYW